MISALAQVIPLGLGAALSSVPITATILILLSAQRQRSAGPFLIGWAAGMTVAVLAATFGAGALPRPDLRPSPYVVGIGELVVGGGLVLYGLLTGVRAIRRRRLNSGNRWLSRVATLGPRSAFVLAGSLNLRPKGLLIAAAVGLAITGAALPAAETAVLVAVYVLIGASTVAVPVVVTLVAPGRLEPWLLRIRDWLDRNGVLVTAVVMGLIGTVIAWRGSGRLALT